MPFRERERLKPVEGANRSLRRRLDARGELALAALPTGTVLIVLALVEALSDQRLLFASLALSDYLIHLDPLHGMNQVRTLEVAHVTAATAGRVFMIVVVVVLQRATLWLLAHLSA